MYSISVGAAKPVQILFVTLNLSGQYRVPRRPLFMNAGENGGLGLHRHFNLAR